MGDEGNWRQVDVCSCPMNIICKEAQRRECATKTGCEHAKPHQRDYVCSHYCDFVKGIVSCMKIKDKEASLI